MNISIPTLGLFIIPAASLAQNVQNPKAPAASRPATRGNSSPSTDAQGVAPKARQLDEVIVTANRRDEKLFDIPFTAHVLDGEERQTRQLSRTLNDSLQTVPGVMTQRTSAGLGSPFLRGFGGYNTLLLIDGIRINSSVQRSGPSLWQNTVDIFSLERTEVVMGPGSVLYGSDAIGGTINAITKRRTSYEPGVHADGRTFVRYETASHSFIERVEGSANIDDRVGIFAGMTQKDYGDLRAGGVMGNQPGTGFSETDGDLHMDFKINNEWRASAVYQHVDQDDVPRTSLTKQAQSYYGTTVGTDVKRDEMFTRDLLYGRLERHEEGSAVDGEQYTIWWNRQQQGLNRVRSKTQSEVSYADSQSLGASVQGVRDTSIGIITVGGEYTHDFINSSKTNYKTGSPTTYDIQGPTADNAGADYAGIYVQDQIPVGIFEITPGMRLTYIHDYAGQVDNPAVAGSLTTTPGNVIRVGREWFEVTGSLRAAAHVDEDTNIFAGVSQGFRAPTVGDLTEFQTTSVVSLPNTELEPERYLQFETGVKARGEIWTALASYWYTNIDGSIVTSPTGATVGTLPVVVKSNDGDGWVNGVDLQGSLEFTKGLTAFGSGSWMEGYVDEVLLPSGATERNPISRGMPLTWLTGVRYSSENSVWYAEALVRGALKQSRLSNKDKLDLSRIPPGGTPGWFSIDARAGLRICKNVNASFAIENITNENYRIHGSGINEAGTNFIFGVEVRF